MERKAKYTIIFFFVSLFIFIIFTQMSYNTEYKTNEIEEEISDIKSQSEEIKLKVTSEASRTEIEQNNPSLGVNNNVYYLEEEPDEEE